MKKPLLGLALAAPLAFALATPADALACGGCVAPPSETTIVTSHRMALSVSPTQTVLWDQIRYDGDPETWGWILPVKPGAVIELSTDAWFETLDAATTTSVFAPPVNCGNSGSSFDCGCASYASDAGGGLENGSDNPVNVVHRGTVGPFDTVTLSTKTPGVLDDWLQTAGFAVPPDSSPIIDAYIKEGFDFIALKLQPDKSVTDMKPVRVVSPGATPTLPLRMVAIGTGANVAITLFVISEGRWGAKNFGNSEVPVDLLTWDFSDNSSNYSTLRQKALAENSGATWLTTFAKPKALLSSFFRGVNGNSFFGFDQVTGTLVDNIAAAYIQQGNANEEANDNSCLNAIAQFKDSTFLVADPCPPGNPSTDPSCGEISAGQLDARQFECGASDAIETATLDDISSALTGLHPNDTWLVRLEAELPRAALANDLTLETAKAQSEVDPELQARQGTHVDSFCPSGVVITPGQPLKKDDRGTFLVALTTFAAALLALTRRRLRSARTEAIASA